MTFQEKSGLGRVGHGRHRFIRPGEPGWEGTTQGRPPGTATSEGKGKGGKGEGQDQGAEIPEIPVDFLWFNVKIHMLILHKQHVQHVQIRTYTNLV